MAGGMLGSTGPRTRFPTRSTSSSNCSDVSPVSSLVWQWSIRGVKTIGVAFLSPMRDHCPIGIDTPERQFLVVRVANGDQGDLEISQQALARLGALVGAVR